MITVQGYSGCPIQVVRDPTRRFGCEYIVEKTSSNAGYVKRFLLQIEKQIAFLHFNRVERIVTPRILFKNLVQVARPPDTTVSEEDLAAMKPSQGSSPPQLSPTLLPITMASTLSPHSEWKNEIASCTFGMQFEHHTNAISFLSCCTVEGVEYFGNKLVEILEQYVNFSPLSKAPASTFIEKLHDVQRILSKNSFLHGAEREFVLTECLPKLLSRFEPEQCDSIDEETGLGLLHIPLGKCHGDLTLSNLLVQERFARDSEPTIVVIDFLDSFIESPLADLAKMAQDLLYGWTLRLTMIEQTRTAQKSHSQPLDYIRLFSVFELLHRKIQLRFSDIEMNANRRQKEEKEDEEPKRPTVVWYDKWFHPMLTINQLRVLQYSQDADVVGYLVRTLRAEYECL